MAVLVVLVMCMLVMLGGADAAWCVCRSDVSDSALQKTLDYACGAGADCNPVLENGACFSPNTVRAHCSYAANSYYQRKGQVQTACDFAGTASISNTDPSYSGCAYPATQSAAGTSTGTTSSTPGSTTSSFSPPGTVLGGLGPSGNSISSDNTNAGRLLPLCGFAYLAVLTLSLMFSLKALN